MSGLVAYALRTCLGAALVDRTLAKGRVHDSAVQALDEMIRKEPAPFLVISTDDEELSPQGWQLLDAPRAMSVVVEIAIGGMVRIDLPAAQGGGQALRLDIPSTDERLETVLNLIGRQVYREILASGAWSEMFRAIAFSVTKVAIRRGANAEEGVRYAARQYVFTVDTIAEPEFGVEPEAPWPQLLAMMDADARLKDDVPLLRSMIAGEPLDEEHRARIDTGLTDPSYRALGLGPMFAGGGEPVATRMQVDRASRGAPIVETLP